MLSGFNTNIRHRGVLFHVQSEDSGRNHPHIITHLYYGGTILASEKSSYEDKLHEPNLPQVVRELMERQHKAVLKRLRARAFDEVIVQRLGAGVFADSTEVTDTRDASDTKPQPLAARRAERTPLPASPADGTVRDPVHPFGEGIVSDKPLDEVILKYLVENARKRKRSSSS